MVAIINHVLVAPPVAVRLPAGSRSPEPAGQHFIGPRAAALRRRSPRHIDEGGRGRCPICGHELQELAGHVNRT